MRSIAKSSTAHVNKMANRHQFRKSNRSPEETARLRADRERYQREKPSPEQLLKESGHSEFVPLEDLLHLHEKASRLKRERQKKTRAK